MSKEKLTSSRFTVKDDTLWSCDSHFFIVFWMSKGQFNGFFNFLDLIFRTPNIFEGFLGSFFEVMDTILFEQSKKTLT